MEARTGGIEAKPAWPDLKGTEWRGSNFGDAPVDWAALYSHQFTCWSSSFLKIKLEFLQVLRLFFFMLLQVLPFF